MAAKSRIKALDKILEEPKVECLLNIRVLCPKCNFDLRNKDNGHFGCVNVYCEMAGRNFKPPIIMLEEVK